MSPASGKPQLGCAWYLTGVCNYDCPYCYDQSKPTRHPVLNMDDVRRVFGDFARARGPLRIAITGGEPTLHPRFREIVSYLDAEGHWLGISTNLSSGAEPFITSICRPADCHINASFHPSRSDVAVFGAEVRSLDDAGFPVSISYVLYPPHVERFEHYLEAMAEVAPGVEFRGAPFVGTYPGRECRGRALPGSRESEPRTCRSGCDYFAILPTGAILRCVQGAPIRGDVWPTVRLNNGPSACPMPRCDCIDMHKLWRDNDDR